MTTTVAGITYTKPTVTLLQETGIGTAEIAARTCYDSFEASEHDCVRVSMDYPMTGTVATDNLEEVNSINHSDLLDNLAWTYFHHSILEHANLTYLIKGTSRGALQEQARHRIQAISVRSTRYTMSSILNAFVALEKSKFIEYVINEDLFVVTGFAAELEASQLWDKLNAQSNAIGTKEFLNTAIAKSSVHQVDKLCDEELFEALQAGKKKRNVGDAFKWVVTDNWKVDLVVTFNVRSLKNYLTLRDSGAAYFLMRELAIAIKEATPKKYLDLIVKG